MHVEQLWQAHRVLVCVGTGGVGKTTVAAALAMAAAQQGRRVLVMTIDPSRRLAQSLGILGHDGDVVPVRTYESKGRVDALVLDVQRTFDALIEARAKSPAQAKAIRENRIYQHFSASLAGSHEYAAIEKLYDAVHDDNYDLIVLDTPPAQNAIDFLEAPSRILQFLQGQSLVERVPGGSFAARIGRKLFDLGGGLVKSNVAKIAGTQTLDDVLAFLRALTDMYDSFCERAEGVERLLRSDACAFVLMASTGATQQAAIARFEQDLQRFGIAPKGYVLNRLRPLPFAAHLLDTDTQEIAAQLKNLLAQRSAEDKSQQRFVSIALEEWERSKEDALRLSTLQTRVAPRPVYCLYEQANAVDSPDAIDALAKSLRDTHGAPSERAKR